jgi:hypothetical protein
LSTLGLFPRSLTDSGVLPGSGDSKVPFPHSDNHPTNAHHKSYLIDQEVNGCPPPANSRILLPASATRFPAEAVLLLASANTIMASN